MGSELVQGLLLAPGATFSVGQGVAFLALVLVVGILATARPLLTLVVLFGGPTWGLLVGEDGLSSLAGLIVVGGLVWGEHHLRATEWSEVFPAAFELQGVVGIGVAWAWLVVGAATDGATVDLGSPPRAMGLVGALLAALALHAVVYRARARVWRLVRDVGFAGVATLLETAIIALVAGILLFAPFVALGIVALGVMPLLVAAGAIRGVQRVVDGWRRAPCPACGRPVRVEASRCPHCRQRIPVVVRYG